jgi:hypothetical protein
MLMKCNLIVIFEILEDINNNNNVVVVVVVTLLHIVAIEGHS